MPDESAGGGDDERIDESVTDSEEPLPSDDSQTASQPESESSPDDLETDDATDLETDERGGTDDDGPETGDGDDAETTAVDEDTEAVDDPDAAADDDADTEDADGDADTTDDAVDTSDDSAAEKPEAKTDGEGYVGDQPDQDEEYPDPDEDIGGISTPPDDEEMPLADHIEEMVLRLAVVFLFGAAGTAIGILWASEAISFIWTDVVPQASERPPHIYHPLELWLTRIKLSALLGIMIALPMLVYQCYLFMRPGLYPNERKYYLAAVPTSVVLGGLGMIFSYLVVLPILFSYFTFYSEGSADIAYALGETFDLVITLTGFLAIVFQIPLFIMLAIMLGVTTRKWLAEKRLYFWTAFAGLSFMFTMDPTFMAPIFVAITMILLFEGTLLIVKWTGRE